MTFSARAFFSLTLIAAAPLPTGITGVPALRREIKPRELMPLAAWEKEFKIIEGKDRGRLVPFVFQPYPGDAKRWKLTLGDYARLILRTDNAGTLLMERLDLLASRSSIVYEPALPVLPDDVPASGAVRQTGYKMYSVETGKLKRAGRATHVIKRVSRAEFNTPAGVIDGYYVEIEHGMEMEYYSHLQLSLGLGGRLDEGPVYGVGKYKLKKLGVFTETKTSAAALARNGASAPVFTSGRQP